MSVGHSTTSSTKERTRAYALKTPVLGKCERCGKEFLGKSGRKWCSELCGVNGRYAPRPKVERVCLQCGDKFRGPTNKKYCSFACSQKASRPPRAKTTGTCGSCGKEFQGRPDQKWCTRACGAKTRFVPKPPREKEVRPTRTCLHCGIIYVQKDSRKTDYCSRRCRSQAQVARLRPPTTNRKCQYCEKGFRSRRKDQAFCSVECKAKAKIYEHVCSWCKKTFKNKWPGTNSDNHFCSVGCGIKHHGSIRPKSSGSVECLRCGKTVDLSSGFHESRKYCSAECRKHVARKTGKYLRRARVKSHPSETFTVRFLIARDKGICQLCKNPVNKKAVAPAMDSPSIDHVIPLAKGGSHTKANTQLACFGCNSAKGDRVDSLF